MTYAIQVEDYAGRWVIRRPVHSSLIAALAGLLALAAGVLP